MATWKIKRADGTTRTLAACNVTSLRRTLTNQGTSTVEFTIPGTMKYGDPFDDREEIQITLDDAVWFRGYNILSTPSATGAKQMFTVRLADVWWYLENTVYSQTVTFCTDASEDPTPAGANLAITDFTTADQMSSSVMLGEDNAGAAATTDERIQAVLDYARYTAGINLQSGTIDAGIDVGREAAEGITCAEAIKKALRWTPDHAVWIDYTTDPVTIHVRSRTNRTAYEVDLDDEETEEVSIAERRDLVLSGVRIEYIREHERPDFKFRTQDVDEAGDTSGSNVLVVPIELYGSYYYNDAVVEAEAVPTGIASTFYSNYSSAQFEGRVRLAMQDCPNVAWLSRRLNVANGNYKWASMAADIQSVVDDVFTGRTEITIGPPQHLGIQDLVGLLRNGRTEEPDLEDLLMRDGGSPHQSSIPQDSIDPRISFSPQVPDVILSAHYFVTPTVILTSDGLWVDEWPNETSDFLITATTGGLEAGVGTVVDFHGVSVGRGPDKYDIPDATPYPYTGYTDVWTATFDQDGSFELTRTVT